MSIPKETSAPVAKSASAKKMLMGDLMQTVGILPILILIVAVFGFIAPNFFTESNLLNITRQASINIVLAAGMTFIILTGGIDLSVGSILGTTAVAAMVVSLIPAFALLSIPAALMLGLLLGLFNGALVAFAGLPPFIVTLGTYTALRGAAYLLADCTTVINSDISFEWIGNDYLGPVPWLVVIALAVIAVCWFILRRTTLGVHIYAVGGNMQAARLTGCRNISPVRRHGDNRILALDWNLTLTTAEKTTEQTKAVAIRPHCLVPVSEEAVAVWKERPGANLIPVNAPLVSPLPFDWEFCLENNLCWTVKKDSGSSSQPPVPSWLRVLPEDLLLLT